MLYKADWIRHDVRTAKFADCLYELWQLCGLLQDSWRRNMLKNLCGSGAVVKSALWGFKEHPGMKLLGPRDFVHVGRRQGANLVARDLSSGEQKVKQCNTGGLNGRGLNHKECVQGVRSVNRGWPNPERHATFTPGFCQAMECRENEVGKARLFMRTAWDGIGDAVWNGTVWHS